MKFLYIILLAAHSMGISEMKSNRLINEKSPYLLQHADNPVDWYPWGEEAFQKARKEDKPILLSIGYSTCHWCHVMERESFKNAAIADIMNSHFVCIKLDREERPDVDRIYMTAVQAMTGSGGWPLNVFLTPDLKPFYGGTYFPPEPRWGQPGFPQLLERIAELWKSQRDKLVGDSKQMTQALAQHSAGALERGVLDATARGSVSSPDAAWLDRAFKSYRDAFDPDNGGFGGAPKFPMPVQQNFLLRYYGATRGAEALEMVKVTLRKMAEGGIYDQIGGGFHRYSTDAQWRVPHFEKMLYDNAQLAVNYLEAYQVSKDSEMARISRETLDYVLRDMTHPEGGFYSAEDADSIPPEAKASGNAARKGSESSRAVPGAHNAPGAEKSEGAFYLWTQEELRQVLGEDEKIFSYRYGVRPAGNAPSDPHGEFQGKNILYKAHSIEETAKHFGLSSEHTTEILNQVRTKLLALRAKRPRTGLDDKVLSSWNGLMISAFAKGYQVLGERRYLEAAEKSVRFIRNNLYDAKARRLYRRWRDGERVVDGMADDYAFLVQGLLDLYESSFDITWLDWAVELSKTQNELFYDREHGGFFMTAAGDPRLIIRSMDDADNVEPSANSIAALNLLRLAQFTDLSSRTRTSDNSFPADKSKVAGEQETFQKSAEKTLERFGLILRERPLALPQMFAAVRFALAGPKQIVIVGDENVLETWAMLRAVHSRFLPDKILLLLNDRTRKELLRYLPFLKGMRQIHGKPAAYVCVHYACQSPTADLDVFVRQLEGS